jgi:hypothetical protein
MSIIIYSLICEGNRTYKKGKMSMKVRVFIARRFGKHLALRYHNRSNARWFWLYAVLMPLVGNTTCGFIKWFKICWI